MSSTQVTPLGSYRGSSPALDRRGWNLALGFQEVFTAVVRLRYNRQAVSDAETFRAQMRQALRVAEQEARSRGCMVPVVLMSAGRDLAREAAVLGASHYLAKPFSIEELEAKLAAVLGA